MMQFSSCYVREQKWYSHKELKDLISEDTLYAERIIGRLSGARCLNRLGRDKAMTDLNELPVTEINSDVNEESSEDGYVFTYVGVIIAGHSVFMCYPKYFKDHRPDHEQMKQVFDVINRYNSEKKQDLNHLSESGTKEEFNLLPIILFLIKDYYDYGVYIRDDEIIELNGEGTILWDKTVDECIPVFSSGKPYYVDIFDRKVVNDEEEIISRLHRVVLDECSEYLKKYGLLDLLSLEEIQLTDERRENLGEDEFLADAVFKELGSQYNTRNQILLETLYSYITQNKVRRQEEQVSFYGTTAFYDVWEKVCASVLNDCLRKKISVLPYGSFPYDNVHNNKTLLELIERPVWRENGKEGDGIRAGATLIPDIICLEISKQERYFAIFDAKYYNMEFNEEENRLSGQPGIESITKQYLYQLAYRDFLREHRVERIGNCFLMPSEGDSIILKGRVTLQMFQLLETEPGLVPIQVCLLPAGYMFDLYLKRKHISVRELGIRF